MNSTAPGDFPKLLPDRVKLVPTGPLIGVSPVSIGVADGGVTVNPSWFEVRPSAALYTATSVLPAASPLGTATVALVSAQAPADPATFTVLPFWVNSTAPGDFPKLLPDRVKLVPTGPLIGVSPVNAGVTVTVCGFEVSPSAQS